jgi:predicted DCC family thiol-disulfide oxidoreductase YuxK
MPSSTIEGQTRPILLFDDECGVCRRISRWVQASARRESGESSIIVRPIGADPDALRSLNQDLDIWSAYATIHLVMPDGSMKLGGDAVAEVLRNLRTTQWFAWSFAISLFGFRPFQMLLNLAYVILADVRPLFGCESCGTPSSWVKPFHWIFNWGKVGANAPPHFTSLSTGRRS